MKTFTLGALAALSGLALTPTHAAEPSLPEDGWVSWEVPAVDGAPYWCCWDSWERDRGNAVRKTCNLDQSARNTGSRDDETTDAIAIYARVTAGKLDRLQAFAASCPVKSDSSRSTTSPPRWVSPSA